MSNDAVRATTIRVIGDILENAAFVFSDSLESGHLPAADTWQPIGVSLSFSGAHSGTFCVWAQKSFTQSLAANMLGIEVDGEDGENKAIDAFKEIVNIIVGNLCTALYGDEVVIELGLPAILSSERLVVDQQKSDAIWMSAEGTPLLCILETGNGQ